MQQKKGGFLISDDAAIKIGEYASNGREAVNIVQIAGGIAINKNRENITLDDVEWIIESGNYNPRVENKIDDVPQVGLVNGLAVCGPGMGILLKVEATAIPVDNYDGKVMVTGIIDEEETGTYNRKYRRKSTSRSSVDNVITVIRKYLGVDARKYDIHVNFPGGMPIDGPSAGITITTAIYSAITGIPIDNRVAMTGEISIRGFVMPIGGIMAKIEAAKKGRCHKDSDSKRQLAGEFQRL